MFIGAFWLFALLEGRTGHKAVVKQGVAVAFLVLTHLSESRWFESFPCLWSCSMQVVPMLRYCATYKRVKKLLFAGLYFVFVKKLQQIRNKYLPKAAEICV